MKKKLFYLISIALLGILVYSCNDDDSETTSNMIIDHTCTDLAKIPEEFLNKVASELYVAYNNSYWHGTVIYRGMVDLEDFKGSIYGIDEYGRQDQLRFDARNAFGDVDNIESHHNDSSWYKATRDTLKANSKINVVMWCWENGVSNSKTTDIDTYLSLMGQLEKEFTGVKFVYMTGHLDGTTKTDNLFLRNEQIRKFCKDNNKILFDYADIESYNPDGVYYGDKLANDTCGYDSNNDGKIDKNWARDWQIANPKKWYNCGYNNNDRGEKNHPLNLNANYKAYATWWMLARIAGWEGSK